MSTAGQASLQPLANQGTETTGLPQKIVVIGGGTGNSTVVRALTQQPFAGESVTAIATTFDDGGGTGELRKVYRNLPGVGDIRQCIDAMSRLSPRALRALARRFGFGDAESKILQLQGQTLGNLMVAGIMQSEFEDGGSFSSALGTVGEIFQTKGRVVPPSDDIRTLVFDLPNGSRILGEHNAEEANIPSFRGANISFLDGHGHDCGDVDNALKPAIISEDADRAIREADIVLLAPGDLYTSIAPNLAVSGMSEALRATKVVMMISNLMNRSRHTAGFTTADYVAEYERIIGGVADRERVIDRVIYNTAELDPGAMKDQAEKGSYPVLPDVERLDGQGYVVRGFDLISRKRAAIDLNDALALTRSEIRHDPAKLADAVRNVYLDNGFSGK
ncbi:MAG TPA: gluconeogenesis factor YvcK family protein [Candidatus Saccharimonadales bacterium]|jgi:uncharacterized cofD-like protein